jgi:hypothetical protein
MISQFDCNHGEILEIIYPEHPTLQEWQKGDYTNPYPYRHIIKHIVKTIGITKNCCVEFGAWDGIFSSQTRPFIIEENWRACLIEGSPERFAKLTNNYSELTKFSGGGGVDN